MIMIEVDEAFAFDMLAIMQIKSSKSDADLNNYTIFLTGIYDEIPHNIVNAVLKSDEYGAMIDANQKVFNLIDQVVSDEKNSTPEYYTKLFAITIHEANMKRFYAKQALQEKFFENNLTERKTVR